MTERFVLRDAINALRDTSGESHDADATRRRIVGTIIHKKRQRRQTIAMLLMVFVGLPLGTTAYAAFFGAPAFVQEWFDRTPGRATAATTPARLPTTRVVQAAPGVAPPAMPETTEAGATTTTAAPVAVTSVVPSPHHSIKLPAPHRAKSAVTLAVAPTATHVTPVVAPDASDTLYTRAHQLHFVTRDPTAALAAWDAYIAQARSATLLPEAQYNRALCLVRLHRNAEAIDALTPFANGAHGNYRKREATALLNALHH